MKGDISVISNPDGYREGKVTTLTGLSPNKFIRHIRLNKTKMLLQNPETNINVVAYDTGFSDPAYFSRVFKKEFGMTPLKWKDRVGPC